MPSLDDRQAIRHTTEKCLDGKASVQFFLRVHTPKQSVQVRCDRVTRERETARTIATTPRTIVGCCYGFFFPNGMTILTKYSGLYLT